MAAENFESFFNITNTTVSQVDQTPLEPQLIFGGILIVVVIVGLIGNCTVLSTILILKEYKKSVTNWYILQLAIADTLFIIMLPLTASSAFAGKWNYPEWVCRLKEGMIFINYYASIYFLVIMSFDRFLAVTKAFASKKWVTSLRSPTSSYIISLIGWTISIVACVILYLNSNSAGGKGCGYRFPSDSTGHELGISYENQTSVPITTSQTSTSSIPDSLYPIDYYSASVEDLYDIFDTIITTYEDDENETNTQDESIKEAAKFQEHVRVECQHPHSTTLYVWLWSNFFAAFLLPLFLICLFYGMIMRTIMRAGSSGIQEKQRSYRRRVTTIVLALVALFVLTWLPWYIVQLVLINGIDLDRIQCGNLTTAVRTIAYLNSALNPYFYSFLGTHFRDRFARVSNRLRITSSSRSRGSSISSRKKRKYSTSNSATNKEQQMQPINGKEDARDEKRSTVQRTERTILA